MQATRPFWERECSPLPWARGPALSRNAPHDRIDIRTCQFCHPAAGWYGRRGSGVCCLRLPLSCNKSRGAAQLCFVLSYADGLNHVNARTDGRRRGSERGEGRRDQCKTSIRFFTVRWLKTMLLPSLASMSTSIFGRSSFSYSPQNARASRNWQKCN